MSLDHRTRSYHPDTVWSVYLLVESDTGEVRYVGKTMRPQARLYCHMHSVRGDHMRAWIAELKARGARAEMLVLRQTPHEWEADIWELEEVQRRLHLDGLLNRRLTFGRQRVLARWKSA